MNIKRMIDFEVLNLDRRPLYEQRERVQAALTVANYARDRDDLRCSLETLGLDDLGPDWRKYLPADQQSPEERLRMLLVPFRQWSMNTIREFLPDLTSREVQTILGRWRRDDRIRIVGQEPSNDPRARGRRISIYQWEK